MPDAEPYRAWQTFTFTAATGHVREVDLFIATPGGLFLVEIKSHPGRVTNNGSTWLFRDERTRTIENPLHFTDLKAKELAGRLTAGGQGAQPEKRTHSPRRGCCLSLCDEPEVRSRRVPAGPSLRPRRPH